MRIIDEAVRRIARIGAAGTVGKARWMRRAAGAASVLGMLGGMSSAATPQRTAEEIPHGWNHVVVPQTRAFALDPAERALRVERVHAAVEVRDRTARTTLDVFLANPGTARAEAVLLLPVPDGAAVDSFLFDGPAAEPTAQLLPAAEARRTYDEIVARVKDPALLEFAGYRLIRSSVFPVEPGGRRRLRIAYDHVLEAEGDRIDYVLPRSESLASTTPWNVTVRIEESRPISMVYSPTHALDVVDRAPRRVVARTRPDSAHAPGAFRLCYLLEGSGVSASVVAYPDPAAGGGYFLLMAGLPASLADAEQPIRREVTLVLDRSGSMAGEKLDQARRAALQVIEGLGPDECFNVVDYASQAASLSGLPLRATARNRARARAYLASLRPAGGTNVHDALLTALRQPTADDTLPLVLFLTDGLPTVGRTSETEIRDTVAAANHAERRIFTFGVGDDVNAPLLDRLSDSTRATSTYVLPGEDVEVRVAKVYRELFGPVLAGPELEVVRPDGAPDTTLVRDLLPLRIPDLFEGDHLVLLGRYREERAARVHLSGNFFGEERVFAFDLDFSRASTHNAFVPRLWAARRIAFLADEIRQAGAERTGARHAVGSAPGLFRDPRYRELSEEILRLSTRFGILSEYTAFLATEGTDLGAWGDLVTACNGGLSELAVHRRAGESAVSQGRNFNDRKLQAQVDYGNRFWVSSDRRTQFTNVQQVCDRAFFQRGSRWIDSKLVGPEVDSRPARVVDFGDAQHGALLERLVREGRQGLLALDGEILIDVDGEPVLVRNDARPAEESTDGGAQAPRNGGTNR